MKLKGIEGEVTGWYETDGGFVITFKNDKTTATHIAKDNPIYPELKEKADIHDKEYISGNNKKYWCED